MAWGGARVGSGPKPKAKPVAPANPFTMLSGGKGLATALTPPPAPETPIDLGNLVEPPADLPTDQQTFWRTHAPLAIERQTLIPSTVPAFRLLCELDAKKTMVGVMVDKGALGGLRVFMQLAKQVESLMARFCLAPFGKPAKAEKPKVAASNPWASISQASRK